MTVKDDKEQRELEEFKQRVKNWTELELKKKMSQWMQRIEQLVELKNQTKAKKLYHQFQVMVKILKDIRRQKGELPQDSVVMTDDFQKGVLSESAIDEKLAKYYQRFGSETPVEETTMTTTIEEEPEIETADVKANIEEKGYSLSILKSLSGSNPFSEKDMGIPKVKKGKFKRVSERNEEDK